MQHGVMSRSGDGQYGSLNVRKTRVNSFLPDGSETKFLPRPASSPASCNQQHGDLTSSHRADGTPPGFSLHTRQAAAKMKFGGSQPALSDTSSPPCRETSFLSTSKRADNLFVATVPSSPVSSRYRSPYDVGFTIRMIEQGGGSGKEKSKPSSAPPARPRSSPQVHQGTYERSHRRRKAYKLTVGRRGLAWHPISLRKNTAAGVQHSGLRYYLTLPTT
ncbi:UNVERIFIED_CONTAM: hypothetical protein HHA_246555 [Hammondia hammondi]|eukprot:XP_008883715.1 hypothetical protein HHA_246555 [Hammondia hammondi]